MRMMLVKVDMIRLRHNRHSEHLAHQHLSWRQAARLFVPQDGATALTEDAPRGEVDIDTTVPAKLEVFEVSNPGMVSSKASKVEE